MGLVMIAAETDRLRLLLLHGLSPSIEQEWACTSSLCSYEEAELELNAVSSSEELTITTSGGVRVQKSMASPCVSRPGPSKGVLQSLPGSHRTIAGLSSTTRMAAGSRIDLIFVGASESGRFDDAAAFSIGTLLLEGGTR